MPAPASTTRRKTTAPTSTSYAPIEQAIIDAVSRGVDMMDLPDSGDSIDGVMEMYG